MKKSHYLQSLLALSAALGFAASAGASITTLDITEVSDTTLEYSFQGGPEQTVTSATSDSWTFTLPVFDEPAGAAAWTEPGDSSEFNIVSVTPEVVGSPIPIAFESVVVQSDTGNPNADPVNSDGTLAVDGSIFVTFTDDGDGSAGVPDGGSTMMLLAWCVAGLFVLGCRYRPAAVRV